MDCVLCESRLGEPHRVIYQDRYVFVLVNIEPLKEGHVMILPVRHAENLQDLNPEEAQSFLQTIDKSMLAVTEAYKETPMCLINGWKYRTQPHLHAHVLPSKNALRGLYAASEGLHERVRADEATLERIAFALKGYFS